MSRRWTPVPRSAIIFKEFSRRANRPPERLSPTKQAGRPIPGISGFRSLPLSGFKSLDLAKTFPKNNQFTLGVRQFVPVLFKDLRRCIGHEFLIAEFFGEKIYV